MDIRLDGELLTRLIVDRGGVMEFLGELIDRSADGDSKINKATVHRWMKGQLPKNPERLMTLAGILDVDPFALLAGDEEAVSMIAETMLEIVQHENSTPAPLQMLRGFFGRQRQWPPAQLAIEYFGREWHVQEFHHDAEVRKNYYQVVALHGRLEPSRPQVFHFAFQSTGRFSARWLEYGFVRRAGDWDTLRHIFGFSQHKRSGGADQPLRVATWFGQGSATFRVASLHQFELALCTEEFSPDQHLEFPA